MRLFFFASRADPFFHLIEILGQGAASGRSQAVFGARHAAFEKFYAGNVLRFLEFAGVNAEIAVGSFEDALEIVEGERLVGGKSAHDAQANAFVNQAVEFGEREHAGSARGPRSCGLDVLIALAQRLRSATVPPRDQNTEQKMESSETGGKKPCAPGRRTKNCKATENHEADAHDWDGGHGERAAGDDARAIKQQPCGGQRRLQAHAEKRESEKRACDQRRKKSERNFAPRAGENGKAAAVGFPEDGKQRDGDGEQTFTQPHPQPGKSGRLARGKPGGAESGEAENYQSPSGDGGESGGTLHGVTDEAQIVDGVGIGGAGGQRPRFAAKMAEPVLARFKHIMRIAVEGIGVKYF